MGTVAKSHFDEARWILPAERDHALALNDGDWPQNTVLGERWDRNHRHLSRIIDARRRGLEKPLATSLKESILRFPSAPMHGVHRLHNYHNNLPISDSFHTYRILTAPKPDRKFTRIFLFHNGLNELDRMGLYYQLASHLIASDKSVACVLRPFPGHLTRAPFADFAENPLHRYLWDGSHLFRQFLRYMTETQWFLSALVRRSRYRCASGAELLAEAEKPRGSRLETPILANAMLREWRRLLKASRDAPRPAQQQPRQPKLPATISTSDAFEHAIDSLREALQLEQYEWLDGGLRECADDGVPESANDGDLDEPSLHVVGYSLGGFAAQSIFMSWPFLIASCSTLLSGGALRELAPTAFANPEEWQTVLHSLRYELDEGMLSGRYGDNTQKELAGLERDLFLFFQRTFYEVFQQEYRGSFQSRVEAFRQRMLFIVGGDDPIVRPRSVLDSAPPGGINLLEVGGLGHFLGSTPKGTEGEMQQSFWLPEIGKLIGRFSKATAERHRREQRASWLGPGLEVKERPESPDGSREGDDSRRSSKLARLSDQDLIEIGDEGALRSKLFGQCLSDLLARQEENPRGLLLILRNELPTCVLDKETVHLRARAFHHDDLSIMRYCHGIQERWYSLKDSLSHVRLVMPWNAKLIVSSMDPVHGFPSQSETAFGQMRDQIKPSDTWLRWEATASEMLDSAPGSIVVFDGRKPLCEYQSIPKRAGDLIRSRQDANDGAALYVPSLPDCWIWASPSFLNARAADLTIEQITERFIHEVNDHQGEDSDLSPRLRDDELRIITVSRARYNPRFRGNLVVDVRAVRQTLLHAALCLAASYDYGQFDLDRARPRTRRKARKRDAVEAGG